MLLFQENVADALALQNNYRSCRHRALFFGGFFSSSPILSCCEITQGLKKV